MKTHRPCWYIRLMENCEGAILYDQAMLRRIHELEKKGYDGKEAREDWRWVLNFDKRNLRNLRQEYEEFCLGTESPCWRLE